MPVFRAFGVAVLCFAILALAAMPLLHLAGGQRRVFVALVLLVWAPYVAALLRVSRHPSLRWVGRLLLAGQVIVFGFQVLVPPVAVAALVGHLLLMAISSYLCGLARGLVAGAAGAAFTLLARAVAGGTAELDYFTLAIFAGMGIALVTLLDMTGREQRRAVAELYRLDEVKTTFLHAVSHDLRTPLTAVLGIAATLEQIGETLPAAERLELTTALAAKARRMDQLLSDLLDIDRLSRGAFDPSLTPAVSGRPFGASSTS